MADRIAHDHPTVETVSGTLSRYGGTNRPEIRLEELAGVADGDLIRVVLDGVEYRSRITARSDGTMAIRGAFETPRMARNPGAGTNALAEWVAERGIDQGRTVHVDIVESDFKFGLRAPGETATYATGRPDQGLADIADQIQDQIDDQ